MTCQSCQREIAANSKFCYHCGAKQSEPSTPSVPPPPQAHRRLLRSWRDKKIAGVCAGFADYFDLDPTLVRIAWLIALFIPPSPGGLAYIICWIAMPEAPPGEPVPSTTASA